MSDLKTTTGVLEWAVCVDHDWRYEPCASTLDTETAARIALALRVLAIVERRAAGEGYCVSGGCTYCPAVLAKKLEASREVVAHAQKAHAAATARAEAAEAKLKWIEDTQRTYYDVEKRAADAEAEVARLRETVGKALDQSAYYANCARVLEDERDALRAQVAAVRAALESAPGQVWSNFAAHILAILAEAKKP